MFTIIIMTNTGQRNLQLKFNDEQLYQFAFTLTVVSNDTE